MAWSWLLQKPRGPPRGCTPLTWEAVCPPSNAPARLAPYTPPSDPSSSLWDPQVVASWVYQQPGRISVCVCPRPGLPQRVHRPPPSLPERCSQWNTTRPRRGAFNCAPKCPRLGRKCPGKADRPRHLKRGGLHSGSGLSDGS